MCMCIYTPIAIIIVFIIAIDHYYCDHYHMHRQFSINIPVVINTILRIFKAAAEDVPSVWRLHLGLGEDRRHKIL